MTDRHIPNPDKLDDQIADFVDRILEDDALQSTDADLQDQELLELQKIALRLKGSFGPAKIDNDMMQRIQAKLRSEWPNNEFSPERGFFWRRLFDFHRPAWRAGGGPKRAYGLGFAAVVLAFIIIVYTSISISPPDLVGTAGGQNSLLPIFIFLGIVAIVAIWLLLRRR